MISRSVGALVVLAALLPARTEAQVIGTFSWQTQPYCNVITVTINQQGGLYQLTGTDNLCGAGTAPVTGTAVPVGAGVAFGLTAALPSGRAAHLSANISLAALSGTWADGDGHTGAFAYGATAAGSARPAPAPATAITVAQFSSTVYGGTGAASTVARSDHLHDDRYYPRSQAVAATALGPRGLIAQAEVFQNSASFRYSRSSNGQEITVSRPFAGTSMVVLPGFQGEFDQTVQVTATAFYVTCTVVSRSSDATRLIVQVNCINPSTLAPVDSSFFITVTA